MIKNVAIYCRVSTDEQKKFGISVNDQKDSLTKYCKNNNYKIYDYYIDEGVSAGSISKRKELVRLLKDLDNIDLIIFTKLDRFSRNVCDANNLLVTLDKHDTSFRAIDEDDIDTSTADGRFIFNLKVNLAEHERNKDSERIKRVNNYKYHVVKTVCTGRVPFGYKVSKDKKMIIDEETAPLVKELFNYYISCRSLNQTRIWFSETYYKRSIESIKKYLKNTCYIGKFKTASGETLDDFCKPIVDEETFYKVQNLLEKNIKLYMAKPIEQRRNKIPYIFTGLLKCPVCNRKLSGKSNTGSHHYYNCRYHDRKKCTYSRCTREVDIEKYFLKNIMNVVKNKKIEVTNIKEKVKESKIDSVLLIKKMNKLTDLYLNELVDMEYYKREYNRLKNELQKTYENKKHQKIDIKHLNEVEELLKNDFLNIYNTLDNLEKRELWSSIIDYAIINDKDNIDIFVY